MKAIKFLLVSLMVMLGTAAFAQDVVIHKTDGTTEVIENADSVVYDVKDYGYYGWIDSNTAMTATQFTPDMFNIHFTKDLPLVLTDTSKFTGNNYLIIALPNNPTLTCAFESTLGNGPIIMNTGSQWEVNNTVTINSKTFYVFIATLPISNTITKLTITKS